MHKNEDLAAENRRLRDENALLLAKLNAANNGLDKLAKASGAARLERENAELLGKLRAANSVIAALSARIERIAQGRTESAGAAKLAPAPRHDILRKGAPAPRSAA